MSYPSIVRHRKDELMQLRESGLTLREIASRFGVHETSIRKAIGKTGVIKEWRSKPLEIRFWNKVAKGDGCWIWTGSTGASGYGHITVNGKHVDAHRVSYTLANGEIPGESSVQRLPKG